MIRSWGIPLLALGVFLLPLPAGLTAAGLSEESRLAKLESRCCDGDDRACVKLLRTRLELAEAKGEAYLPAPAMDGCLYAGVYTWAGVKELLVAAAKTTTNPAVGEYAVTRLEDQKLLADIAQTAADKEVRHSAVCRLGEPRWLAAPAIQSLLMEAAKTASDQTRRQAAALKLSDPTLQADAAVQALLVEAVHDRLIPVATRAEVVGRIRDEAALVEIARGQGRVADSVRVAAVSRLTNQVVLVEIARHAPGIFLQVAAVARLTDEAVLIEMATEDAHGEVRAAAVERFFEMLANRCGPAAVKLESLRPGDAVGIEDRVFSTHPGSREDKVVAQLRVKNRAYLRSVLSALGFREPAGVEASGVVIQYAVVLSPVAVMYYPVPATGGGPGGRQFTAAKARGLVSLRAGDRCAALGSIERETRPPESISYKDDLSPTTAYAVALTYWTGDALKSVLAAIRPTQQQLAQLVRSCVDWDPSLASRVIYDHIEDPGILAEFATKHEDWVIRYAAAARLEDQAVLAHLVRTDARSEVRASATRRLTDQELLSVIARTDEDRGVRAAATERLTDQELLSVIARTDVYPYVRAAATKRLTDRDLLRTIAAGDPDADVRAFAEVRLWKLEHGEP